MISLTLASWPDYPALTGTTANNKAVEELPESKATPATSITPGRKEIYFRENLSAVIIVMKALAEAGK